MKNKQLLITRDILQAGVWWYANCGFSFRSSESSRTGTLPEIHPDNMYQPL